MTPEILLEHNDTGELWPVCAGEAWTARFDSAVPALEVRFV